MSSKIGSQNDRIEEYGEYILSKTVKSVHRTYFLDVRATKGEDLFVTITESRKRQNPDGTQFYDRHKLVLYKEDIRRFCEEFGNIEKFLKDNRPQYFEDREDSVALGSQPAKEQSTISTDIEFEDL